MFRTAGQVLGGLDYGLTDADGNFNPDVVYLLQTSSGCDILVREKGHAPNVFMLFETACDDYDWMNGVVAYGKAARVAGGISMDVWKVSAKWTNTSRHTKEVKEIWRAWAQRFPATRTRLTMDSRSGFMRMSRS